MGKKISIIILLMTLLLSACGTDSDGEVESSEPPIIDSTSEMAENDSSPTITDENAASQPEAEGTDEAVPATDEAVSENEEPVPATEEVSAQETATASSLPPTVDVAEDTPTAVAAVPPTAIATLVPEARATAPPLPTDTPPDTGCVPDFTFVEDVSIPDRSSLPVGYAAVKTWRVVNSGTCTWQRNRYTLVPESGEAIGVGESVPVPVAEPGETVDLSVVLVVPSTVGDYQSAWRMRAPNGESFGSALTVLFKAQEYDSPDAAPLNPPLPVPVAPEFWQNSAVSEETLLSIDTHPYLGNSFVGDIATMQANGSLFNQLTTYGYNADPRPSPDGTQIAYRSVHRNVASLLSGPDNFDYKYSEEGYFNIWTTTLDGVFVQLTDSYARRSIPVWSPDSQKVAFIEGPDHILVEINVAQQTRQEWAQNVKLAKYMPDGRGISYITLAGDLVWKDWNGEVHSLIAASTLPKKASIADIGWLPDGQHLLYTIREPHQNFPHISEVGQFSAWIMGTDGSNPVKLADDFRTVNVAPDGIWVVGESGSGYGDACGGDLHVSFLKLATDLSSASVLHVGEFSQPTADEAGQSFYPNSDFKWVAGKLVLARLGPTCTFSDSPSGHYLIDPVAQQVVQITQGPPAVAP
ncbi:MAG: NBR1-Ig-like domain-containing protein [Ardenticatenaceae bacterium]